MKRETDEEVMVFGVQDRDEKANREKKRKRKQSESRRIKKVIQLVPW